jgi:hypothetical protein
MSNDYPIVSGINLTGVGSVITILDRNGFDFDADGVAEQVSWDNIYNLKEATPALRLPATPNVFVLDDTLECNDNNLAKTRTAVLSAPPSVSPSLVLTDITSGYNSVLTTEDLTFNFGVNSSKLYSNAKLELNDITNGSIIQITPDAGFSINVLPFPYSKNVGLDAYNGLGITDGTSNSSVSATQIQVIDNDPSYPDPKSTTITPTSISVIAGISELDTQITNQNIQIRLNNDFYSNLSTSAINFNDSTGTGFGSVFTTQILEMSNQGIIGYDNRYFQIDGLTDPQYPSLYMRDESGYRAELKGQQLAFYNEGTGGTYTLGVNTNDLVINAGGDRLLLNSATAETYWGDYTAGTNANIALNIAGACRADIDIRAGEFNVGDLNSAGNNTKIVINDTNPSIALQTTGAIEVDSGAGLSTIGDVNGSVNGTTISVYDPTQVITLTGGNGVYLQSSTIRYAVNLRSSSTTLAINDTYSQTFNGSSLTATLPLVDGTNVGFQFLITNTNASSLSVNSTGGQLIYSTTGTASATTRTLPVGHSHIFTAIYTTSGSTFGWSMV